LEWIHAGQSTVKFSVTKFLVGQHVKISKEKNNFAKCGEQNYTAKIFKILKAVHKTLHPVYGLEDLLGRQIDWQFYAEVQCRAQHETHDVQDR
jgi:hypothetical protein